MPDKRLTDLESLVRRFGGHEAVFNILNQLQTSDNENKTLQSANNTELSDEESVDEPDASDIESSNDDVMSDEVPVVSFINVINYRNSSVSKMRL